VNLLRFRSYGEAIYDEEDKSYREEEKHPEAEPEARAVIFHVIGGLVGFKACGCQEEYKGDGEEEDQPEDQPEEGAFIGYFKGFCFCVCHNMSLS